MQSMSPGSLSIFLITACFAGFFFTLQVAKEFLYFNTISFIGAILTIAFIRELSPVLISVIVIGCIGSSFTAELATMKVTEQIHALYLLHTNPFIYLIIPRVMVSIYMLPVLNIFSFATSLSSSAFICFILYSVNPIIFFMSSFSSLSLHDFLKSLIKTVIFSLIITIISCYWGLAATAGVKGVGQSTTSSVFICLLTVFILDFILYLVSWKVQSRLYNLILN